MSRREIEYDDFTGITTEVIFDNVSDSQFTVKKTQDVEPALDQNKREFNDAPEFGRYKGDLHKVAAIPMIVIHKWIKEGINFFNPSPEDEVKIKAKLNSPEYRFLRTRPGRI